MPFTPQAIDFLIENRMRDSKEWYSEHKADYKRLVAEPFAEFIEKIAPIMAEVDGEIVCNPKKISRVYRDTRFTKDKSLFREHIWCMLRRQAEHEIPAFYFEISPFGFEYGCGYYQISPTALEIFRNTVLTDHKLYKKAAKAIKSQDIFTLEGDMYKRNHFPDAPKSKLPWLNRKNIFAMCRESDAEIMFGDNLAEYVGERLLLLKPFYELLLYADTEAAKQEIQPK